MSAATLRFARAANGDKQVGKGFGKKIDLDTEPIKRIFSDPANERCVRNFFARNADSEAGASLYARTQRIRL